jgi:hypothetical protein
MSVLRYLPVPAGITLTYLGGRLLQRKGYAVIRFLAAAVVPTVVEYAFLTSRRLARSWVDYLFTAGQQSWTCWYNAKLSAWYYEDTGGPPPP